MMTKKHKRVKIVASVGPAIRKKETIKKLIDSGVNVFRLNFSHSTYEEHEEGYNIIRQCAKEMEANVAVLADMQGPKLRVGKFKEHKVFLEPGATFTLDSNPEPGDVNRVCLPHKEIFDALKKGDALLIDDGKVRLEVESFTNDSAVTKVINGGYVSDAKGVNFPSGILKLSSLTEKDKKDLVFALELGVDFIGLSFVQLPSDVEQVRDIVKDRAKIISKIEKPSAIDNIKSIIEVSDAIMVARGDLGVEIPTEQVPVVQKQIITECKVQCKPVIVATQMLDSMTNSPVPTRAEASDVANAVYDGADAVMLSGETTVGSYPEETVETMASIIRAVEADEMYWKKLELDNNVINTDKIYPISTGRAISVAVKQVAEAVGAEVIVAFSCYGQTANRISHQKPRVKLVSVTDNPALHKHLCLNWGVTPLLIDRVNSFSEISERSLSWLRENNHVKTGDKVLVVAGVPVHSGGSTNSIRVIEVE